MAMAIAGIVIAAISIILAWAFQDVYLIAFIVGFVAVLFGMAANSRKPSKLSSASMICSVASVANVLIILVGGGFLNAIINLFNLFAKM